MQSRDLFNIFERKLKYFCKHAEDIEKKEAEHLLSVFEIAKENYLSSEVKMLQTFIIQQQTHIEAAGAITLVNFLANFQSSIEIINFIDGKMSPLRKRNAFSFQYSLISDLQFNEKLNELWMSTIKTILIDAAKNKITLFHQAIEDAIFVEEKMKDCGEWLRDCIKIAKDELLKSSVLNGDGIVKAFYLWVKNREFILPESLMQNSIENKSCHLSI